MAMTLFLLGGTCVVGGYWVSHLTGLWMPARASQRVVILAHIAAVLLYLAAVVIGLLALERDYGGSMMPLFPGSIAGSLFANLLRTRHSRAGQATPTDGR